MRTIPPFKDYGAGHYRQVTEMDSKFLGHDVNIKYGCYYTAGKMLPYQTQVCDYNQVLVFMGTNAFDPGDLGAEVDFCIGEEKEKHRITTATSISIPKGIPYGPIAIGPMENRFILMQIALTSEVKAKPVLPDTPEGPYANFMDAKYRENFQSLSFTRNGAWHYGPLNPDTHKGSITNITPKGIEFDMMYEFVNKAPYRFGPEPDKPHVHSYTEFLIHIGCDCSDLSQFPAEEEYCMGEEIETHLITKPTITILPKGVPHCPQRVLSQTKPWIFIVMRPWGGGTVLQGGATTILK